MGVQVGEIALAQRDEVAAGAEVGLRLDRLAVAGDRELEVGDPDDDNDGAPDEQDAFPQDPGESADADGDGVGDNSDSCPAVANPGQADTDDDGIGDACEQIDNTPGCAQGIGQLKSNPKAGFSFLVTYRAGAARPHGVLAFGDTASGRFLTSTQITRFVVTGDTVRIAGIGNTNGGRTVEFEAEVTDRSPTGRMDTFAVRFDGYTASGTLKAGNNTLRCELRDDM
jgi:hypothetical protein